MSIRKTNAVSQDQIDNFKTDRRFREFLPVLIVLFTPITVSYENTWGPLVDILFMFSRIIIHPSITYSPIEMIFAYPIVFLAVSMPALLASIVSSWELHRLSQRKTTARGALRGIVAATLAWAIYLSIYFFGYLFMGQLMIGPLPLPFGPLTAVLSREHIMRLTNEIDGFENTSEEWLD